MVEFKTIKRDAPNTALMSSKSSATLDYDSMKQDAETTLEQV